MKSLLAVALVGAAETTALITATPALVKRMLGIGGRQ